MPFLKKKYWHNKIVCLSAKVLTTKLSKLTTTFQKQRQMFHDNNQGINENKGFPNRNKNIFTILFNGFHCRLMCSTSKEFLARHCPKFLSTPKKCIARHVKRMLNTYNEFRVKVKLGRCKTNVLNVTCSWIRCVKNFFI